MFVLALGLVLFLGVHTVPMAPRLRAGLIGRLGANGWKGAHTLAAAAGLGLIVWGYGLARAEGHAPWLDSNVAMRHATLLVLLPVFPLLFASFLPGRIRARVGHPMLTAVILWALGHLLIVGAAPAVLLFAAFLAWSVADRLSLARRGVGGGDPTTPFGRNDVLAIVLGLAVYAAMLFGGHLWLIGVAPLG